VESKSRVTGYGLRVLSYGLRIAGNESNSPQPATGGSQLLTRYLLWLGAALLLALIVFSNTLANGFVYDDHYLIINNRSLQDEDYLSRVFTPAPQDSPVTGSGKTNAGFVAYYRPFTRALFAINYRVFGLDAFGWHAVNLALYIASITLVFLLLVRITRRIEVAGPATLLFALHPIHSETVSWVNCLVETLHAVFFLMAFLLFVCRRQSEHRHRWLLFAGSILAAICAMLSKETAITLPILVAGYILFIEDSSENLRLRIQSAFQATLPFLAVIAIYLLLRFNAGGGNLEINNTGNIGVTLRTFPAVLVKYLSLLLLPINLSPLYPVRPIDSFLNLHFLIPAVILIALITIVARYYFRNTLFCCGLLLLIVPLAPLLNVGMLLPELMIQDRYLFLPSIGFCLIGGLLCGLA
jgi:protein O-mannosyl-transferase